MGSGMRCAFPFQMPHCRELRGRFTMRSGFSRENSACLERLNEKDRSKSLRLKGDAEPSPVSYWYPGAVDDYLSLCEEEGISPEIAYKGSLNVRFKNSDIHRRAAIYAIMHEQSLNSFIEEAVKEKLALVHA